MSELQGLLARLWADLVARPIGPLEFRFLVQPLVAAVLAVRDGMLDARTGRSPYFWTLVHGTVYPGEAIGIALLLGFVPYLLIRGPTDRIARRRRGGSHGEADQTQHSRHLGR
jgi:hypothetical protein